MHFLCTLNILWQEMRISGVQKLLSCHDLENDVGQLALKFRELYENKALSEVQTEKIVHVRVCVTT